jgi:hypothetical protein
LPAWCSVMPKLSGLSHSSGRVAPAS